MTTNEWNLHRTRWRKHGEGRRMFAANVSASAQREVIATVEATPTAWRLFLAIRPGSPHTHGTADGQAANELAGSYALARFEQAMRTMADAGDAVLVAAARRLAHMQSSYFFDADRPVVDTWSLVVDAIVATRKATGVCDADAGIEFAACQWFNTKDGPGILSALERLGLIVARRVPVAGVVKWGYVLGPGAQPDAALVAEVVRAELRAQGSVEASCVPLAASSAGLALMGLEGERAREALRRACAADAGLTLGYLAGAERVMDRRASEPA